MNERSEFLSADELAEVTGYKHVTSQREWLEKNGWTYVRNASGKPIVGRWYARQKLAGLTPTQTGTTLSWAPNFDLLRPA
jgi:Domain of unknown function (DUF4224)